MSFFPLKTREKTYTENGNIFLYNRPIKEKLPNVTKYFLNKIIKNQELSEAPPGIYTWILRKSENFYAIKTITKQEVGTLHFNLQLFTDPYDSTDIYAAGELEIIKEENYAPTTISFNLLSGTYMLDKFKNLSDKDKLLLRNQIVTNVQTILWNKYGVISQFLECSGIGCSKEEELGGMKIIENANIKTSSNNIKNLNILFPRKVGGRTRKNQRRNKSRKARSKD
jgi:hypothetical protein